MAAAVAPEPQIIAVCAAEKFPDSQPPPHIDSGALAEGQACERVRWNWKCVRPAVVTLGVCCGSMATRTPSVDVLQSRFIHGCERISLNLKTALEVFLPIEL